MIRITERRIGAVAVLALALTTAACGRSEEAPPAQETGDMAGHDMHGMGGMDAAMMRRHAGEADTTAASLRTHIATMRQLPPDRWHDRIGEHVQRVSGMLGLMNRQMREMERGMGMSDEMMGEMMGMTGDEHRRMLEQMDAVRTEAETLQRASAAEVRERMPAHLDRLDEMVRRLEQSAEHMREMGQ